MMDLNLIGRIRNTWLAHSSALNPLFEAIINSIDAIEDRDIRDGEIGIRIKREDAPLLFDSPGDGPDLRPIADFIIEDNGTGFTEENFKSFTTSDSTYKEAKNAKGIGRFLWLKAFDQVHVSSVYKKDWLIYEREFDFLISEDGIENYKDKETPKRKTGTVVYLQRFKKPYQEQWGGPILADSSVA
jgi:hypothetical protein